MTGARELRDAAPAPALTPREHEIMRALVAGKSVKNAASPLHVRTVYVHLTHIRRKAGLTEHAPLHALVLWYARSYPAE